MIMDIFGCGKLSLKLRFLSIEYHVELLKLFNTIHLMTIILSVNSSFILIYQEFVLRNQYSYNS
jgi:hypothetical protein